jgi:hypothetical protein
MGDNNGMTSTFVPTCAPEYPLQVGPTRRYLVDQRGDPFLMVGDAAWSIFVGLTKDEVLRYLDHRRQLGFNTLLTNLLEYRWSPDPPRNRFGDEPFAEPGNFSTLNPAYFDHARWVMDRAAERGFLVLLTPCYLGYAHAGWPGSESQNQGWAGEVAKNGFAGCREYGRYVGGRFGDLDNIMWVVGGDRDPGDLALEMGQMAEGIRAADARHPFTAHCAPESVPADVYKGESWLNVNNTYTYNIVHAQLYADYIRIPAMPFFLMESSYENEHSSSEVQLRRQAYWSILRGGFGHVFGCLPIWPFEAGWEDALDLPGSLGMSHFARAFQGRRWWELVPESAIEVPWDPRDQGRRTLLAGIGESRGLDFCAAASTPDGALIMAYMPTPRRLTLDLAHIPATRARVSWFDPIRGGWADGGDVEVARGVELDPPGDQDWLLAITGI